MQLLYILYRHPKSDFYDYGSPFFGAGVHPVRERLRVQWIDHDSLVPKSVCAVGAAGQLLGNTAIAEQETGLILIDDSFTHNISLFSIGAHIAYPAGGATTPRVSLLQA